MSDIWRLVTRLTVPALFNTIFTCDIYPSIFFTVPFIISSAGADPGEGGCTWCARPLKLKKYDFWRKIVIFHTKYPNNVRVSLRPAQFF
jgi:hypothetical protein